MCVVTSLVTPTDVLWITKIFEETQIRTWRFIVKLSCIARAKKFYRSKLSVKIVKHVQQNVNNLDVEQTVITCLMQIFFLALGFYILFELSGKVFWRRTNERKLVVLRNTTRDFYWRDARMKHHISILQEGETQFYTNTYFDFSDTLKFIFSFYQDLV
jgi:hypothetical protein